MILDCGHPEDVGSPAMVKQSDGALKEVRGWTFVLLDNGKKVCHACADEEVLSCGHHPSPHSYISTGYATTGDGRKLCYACVATLDREEMKTTGRAVLYLSGNKVSNWPGSLTFQAWHVKRGRHNIARVRYDAYFAGPDGYVWHGTQYGDNTQLLHCRRTKEKVSRVA